LVGFVLGDMTGLSIPAAVGAALIDSRFSRDAEREADSFAGEVAQRLAFRPAGLPNLLERVAADDEFSATFALLSTHPLTAERRAFLESLTVEEANVRPVFTDAEWRAIKSMCGTPQASTRPGVKAQPTTAGSKGG
jgi:predicted Zn-dependent protease